MGWRFRKSFKMGPLRWSLSKRGIGTSWGIPGFRVGQSPDGRRYVSLGIPGTGFYYIRYFGSRKHRPSEVAALPNVSFPVPQTPSPSPCVVPVTVGAVSRLPSCGSGTKVAWLTLKRGGALTDQTFQLADRTALGRSDDQSGAVGVDLRALPEAVYISRDHAEIWHEAGQWFIRDVGSQNGTFVRHDGHARFQRVTGQESINSGDEIALGNARFEFRT